MCGVYTENERTYSTWAWRKNVVNHVNFGNYTYGPLGSIACVHGIPYLIFISQHTTLHQALFKFQIEPSPLTLCQINFFVTRLFWPWGKRIVKYTTKVLCNMHSSKRLAKKSYFFGVCIYVIQSQRQKIIILRLIRNTIALFCPSCTLCFRDTLCVCSK